MDCIRRLCNINCRSLFRRRATPDYQFLKTKYAFSKYFQMAAQIFLILAFGTTNMKVKVDIFELFLIFVFIIVFIMKFLALWIGVKLRNRTKILKPLEYFNLSGILVILLIEFVLVREAKNFKVLLNYLDFFSLSFRDLMRRFFSRDLNFEESLLIIIPAISFIKIIAVFIEFRMINHMDSNEQKENRKKYVKSPKNKMLLKSRNTNYRKFHKTSRSPHLGKIKEVPSQESLENYFTDEDSQSLKNYKSSGESSEIVNEHLTKLKVYAQVNQPLRRSETFMDLSSCSKSSTSEIDEQIEKGAVSKRKKFIEIEENKEDNSDISGSYWSKDHLEAVNEARSTTESDCVRKLKYDPQNNDNYDLIEPLVKDLRSTEYTCSSSGKRLETNIRNSSKSNVNVQSKKQDISSSLKSSVEYEEENSNISEISLSNDSLGLVNEARVTTQSDNIQRIEYIPLRNVEYHVVKPVLENLETIERISAEGTCRSDKTVEIQIEEEKTTRF